VSPSKKKLGERPPAVRLFLAVVFIAALALVIAGERDIQRRPAEQVRGSKLFWRVASLNALGAASYFRWGRRPATDIAEK
jgi:hypothetical protein